MIGHAVGEHEPVAGRRLALRAVGPELGQHAREVAARHDLRRVGRAGLGVQRAPRAVVGAQRVVAVGARRDVDRLAVGVIELGRLAEEVGDPELHLRLVPGRRRARVVVRGVGRRAHGGERRHQRPVAADVRLHARRGDDAVLGLGDRQVQLLPVVRIGQGHARLVDDQRRVHRRVAGGVGVVVGLVGAVVDGRGDDRLRRCGCRARAACRRSPSRRRDRSRARS